MIERIAILGAGAWGTALAVASHRAGRHVTLQAHNPRLATALVADHCNRQYLPDISIPADVTVTADPGDAVARADAVLLAVPSQHLRAVIRHAAIRWPGEAAAVICAKGIEQGTGALMSEVVEQTLPQAPAAVLSGPSFAIEVARGLPTAVTFACRDEHLRRTLPPALATQTFRIYSSDDVTGAQLGGAVKNVLAIACGIVTGRGMGDNARAALITRGLAEMARFAAARGARPETLTGLSGLGDLVLTCNALQSRNFSLGVALGSGRSLAEVLGERITVAEGVYTAAILVDLAARAQVEMPICAAVDAVLNRGEGLDETIARLLARPIRAEVFAA